MVSNSSYFTNPHAQYRIKKDASCQYIYLLPSAPGHNCYIIDASSVCSNKTYSNCCSFVGEEVNVDSCLHSEVDLTSGAVVKQTVSRMECVGG